MAYFVLAIIAGVAVLALIRMIGTRQDRMLAQYEILGKRFGLEEKVARSRWGSGLGERHSLSGKYRGYPLSLYTHHRIVAGKRREWTSLCAELLFAGLSELHISFKDTQEGARFARPGSEQARVESASWIAESPTESLLEVFKDPSLSARMGKFAALRDCGALRLSKGFAEYREEGRIQSDSVRHRFQEATLLLGDLADALSLHFSKAPRA